MFYEPASDFLKAIIAGEAPLSEGPGAAVNLRLLIEMTRDPNVSNRDWATMLLAQQEIETREVCQALVDAAEDESDSVRAEAILGLAQRGSSLALSLVRRELRTGCATYPIFEAAERIADPSLITLLELFTATSDEAGVDEAVCRALAACRGESTGS